MFKEFIKDKNKFKISYPIKKYTKFEFIQRRYFEELMRIKNYYRNQRKRSVDNRHILARLIDLASPSVGLDIVEFYKHVSINAKYISKQFDIVSNINKGRVLENELWGNNTYEIFLYVENEIDLFTFENNWENVESLRIIKTSNTDLDFNFPYKNIKEFYTHKLFIYEIDIIKMCLQYKFWSINQLKYGLGNDSTEFVATFVLPNTMDQIMDYAIYNRFIKIAKKEDIGEFENTHPFHILNYSKGIDEILKNIVKDVYNENIPLEQLLDSIPTFTGKNMREVLSLNNKYFTTQSEWILWVSRIDDIVNLHTILGKKGYKRNKDLFHRIPIILKIIERRHSFIENILPIVLKIDFDYNIEYLNKKLGKR